MAKYLILYRIPTDKYYFKDALYIFVASIEKTDQAREFKDDVQRKILTP